MKETNNVNLDELETLAEDIQRNKVNDIKDQIIISVILTVVFFGIAMFLVTYLAKNPASFKSYFDEDTPAILLLFLILGVGLAAYLNLFIQSRKGNGRTSIKINTTLDEKDIKDKMDSILKYLYYKEKNYKNGKAYYAFKDRYTLNTASKKRYISYKINNGEIIIEAWIYIMGRELPIDKKRIEDITKRALAYDLNYIAANIVNN